MWFSAALKLLTAGEFVCPVRFPDEFEALDAPEGRERAERWLGEIGYRLCQLEDGGAFFMAFNSLDHDQKAQVREQFRNLRDLLQPAVRFLETVRQAQGRGEQLQPGQEVVQSALMEAVRGSTSLDRRLQQMRDVHGSRTTESSADRLARILELLEKEGFLHLANPSHMVYLVTGKVRWLYQTLALMAEYTPSMSDTEDEAHQEEQMDLAQEGDDGGPVPGASTSGDGGAGDSP
ncbi:hypothetical protein [Ramlibacter sp. AN1133]|uniref:hypothetical protein n=1 Tax=Ramlibacter sp. AN1133 TaxID=3133429 RepID=UPI0030C25D18